MKFTRTFTTLLAAGASVAAIASLFATSAWADPVVNWTPSAISETVGQGETKTVAVEVVSTESITNAALFLTPELTGHVSVQPAVTTFQKNVPQIIKLTFSAADGEPPAQYHEGTLRMRTNNRTLPKPLAIAVETTKAALINGTEKISYQVPTGWLRSPGDGAGEFFDALSSPQSVLAAQSGNEAIPPDIFISIIPNPMGLDPTSFSESYLGGWLSEYSSRQLTTIDNRPTLIVDDQTAFLAKSPPRAYLIAGNNSMIIVSAEWLALTHLDSFVATFEIE